MYLSQQFLTVPGVPLPEDRLPDHMSRSTSYFPWSLFYSSELEVMLLLMGIAFQ
jgi:hypothetical protein